MSGGDVTVEGSKTILAATHGSEVANHAIDATAKLAKAADAKRY